MGDIQKELDFDRDRGRRLRLIDEAQIPKRPKTSPGTLKHVLRVIESFARGKDGQCWASVATIAKHCCCSKSTVNVATKTLRELNLIAPLRRGKYHDRVIYKIVWGDLYRLTPDYAAELLAAAQQPAGKRPAEPLDQSVIVNNQTTTVDNQTTTVGQQTTTVVAPTEAPCEAQTEPPTNRAAWSVVGVQLNKAGITKRGPDLIEQVRDVLGHTPAEFLRRLGDGLATIREPANAGKLEQPSGALYWRLWNGGGWPRGVTMVTPAEARQRREARAQREARCFYEAIIREVRQQVIGQRTWPEKRTPEQTLALVGLDDRAIAAGVLATGKVPRWYLVEVKLIEEVVSTPGREGAKAQRRKGRQGNGEG